MEPTGGAKTKVVLRNPYARKKPPPRAAPVSTTSQSTTILLPSTSSAISTAISTAAPAARATATTFSQAFGDFADEPDAVNIHNHHINIINKNHHINNNNNFINNHQGPDDDDDNVSDRQAHTLIPHQPHVLYVSPAQKGNPVLTYIRNVPWAYARMTPDYLLAPTRCALFLSCKYHALYPQYIYQRLAAVGRDFELRVLLVLVDVVVDAHARTLRHLNHLAVVHDWTLLLAWSDTEAARYLETLKALDGKDATWIQKKKTSTNNIVEQVTDVLTAVVNQTDAGQLLAHFGSLHNLVTQATTPADLALVPGMGPVKVKRLYDAWHQPFSKRRAAARKKAPPPPPPPPNDDDKGQEALSEQQASTTDEEKEEEAKLVVKG